MQRPNIFHQIYTKVCITNISTFLCSAILILVSFVYMSCGNPLEPVDSEEEARVKTELKDRSFRQFDPSKDAMKRKGVILDFFDGEGQIISLWAQYAEGETALNEWEIFAKDYRVEKAGSEYRIYFDEPSSRQILPNECENCLETAGISVSIRNLYNREKIQFKLNDEDDILPSPFPVFKSWTNFNEDEYFH
ncbi:MAG: hypothetical protein OXU23_19495 [Candidatus Poribacteria bacterium]|nr:hypothetical protein [Candidatus Poribacteria bacterium]